MKEKYLKARYFGKFGEITDMTYNDGSPLRTGDIVKLLYKDGSIRGHRIVVHNKDEYGVLGGVLSSKFINGRSSDWSIELVNKYYDNNETEIGDIVIKLPH